MTPTETETVPAPSAPAPPAVPPEPETQDPQYPADAIQPVKMDWTTRTLTMDVALYELDPLTGLAALTPEGKRTVKETVGPFVFRMPTLGDMRDSSLRRVTALGAFNIQDVPWYTLSLVNALSTVPYLALQVPAAWPELLGVAPKDWTAGHWEKLPPTEEAVVLALQRELNAATERFRRGPRA